MIRRGRAALAVLALGYAALALASGADRAAANSAAKAERFPRILAAQSLGLAGDRALADGRPDEGLAIAQAAIARAPIEPTSTALLGAAWLAKGDEDRAQAAFTVAGKLGWRVPLTQLYWMRGALAAGDARVAALRLDALLRQNHALLREDALLAPVEASADGRAALAARLALRPPWLPYYVDDHGEATPQAMQRRAAVLLLLAGQGTRLGCNAIAPAARRLVVLGDTALAQQVWHAHCPNAPMPTA